MKVSGISKQHWAWFGLMALLAFCPWPRVRAQDLSPRAYLITPYHSNAVTLTWSFYDGSLNFNGALATSDAKGQYNISVLTAYHSFGILGRFANFVATIPYAEGNFHAITFQQELHIYRLGLGDSIYRLAVNLKGGPAMEPREFGKWRQKVLLGASLKVMAPTRQYDPTKLIN